MPKENLKPAPVADASEAAPPPESARYPSQGGTAKVMLASFYSLERAQELPEVLPGDERIQPLKLGADSIQFFKGIDRRTMEIVWLGAEQGFAVVAAVQPENTAKE